MDIQKKLEAEHSKALTTAITNYIGSDKQRFKVLMDIFLGSEYRLTQRAAWPLSYVLLANPQLLTAYYPKLIKKLQEPGNHPAIARNILRVFQEMDIPEKYRGQLIDTCFKFITSETAPVAVRAFAITTASNICRHYPELGNELVMVLRELSQLPQTAAIKQRIKLALKVLKSS